MARISQYQVDTNISDNDQLLGTDAEDANLTKKFTVGDLSAYINGQSSGAPGSGTVTSVTGTGTVSGITLSGNVTSTGSLTLGGSLSLTSQEIINFLGYTPSSFDGAYNSLTGKPTIPAASAILANSGTPTLATGITAEEIRTLIGAGDGSGSIESVTGTAPIVSSGGTTPAISINAATTSSAGSMSAADKTKLDGIGSFDDYVQNSEDIYTTTSKITQIISLTQAEYNNIGTYAPGTLYVIL